ncbi:MAG: ImmA/IrrE family metallo-endopeptidase [Mogibacterium sp.]|nr:ImmA/IrrE family metallo-endopeptidase [Mogibacterium sp.]
MTDRDRAVFDVVNRIVDTHVFRLPVDIEKICRIYGAYLLPYSKAVGNSVLTWDDIAHLAGTRDGFTLDAGAEWAIVYNDKACENRKRFTFAEELMHRLLLHSQDDDFLYTRQSYTEGTYRLYETEAKRGAGMVLVPPSVYYRLRLGYSHAQIAKLCRVSAACVYTVAKYYDENEDEIRSAFTKKHVDFDKSDLKRKKPLRPRVVEGKSL